ncbi:MAG TPA: hypothetical protein VK420_16575 [Longimicrobium sp.]|nr:hypothetical protein [Longimicrobium sp.]
MAVTKARNAAGLFATGVSSLPPTTNCSSASKTCPICATKSPMYAWKLPSYSVTTASTSWSVDVPPS